MAEIRCPNCGKNNPDLLDVCQFCQAPLKRDSVLRIGDTPTKKNTGELENVLPDWLRDVRQQARTSAEEDAANQPKVQKNEPPDLLAGLASEASSADEEEIPDWLASINPTAKAKPAAPSAPAPAPEPGFFARFNQSEVKPPSEPPQEKPPASAQKDELSEWFSQAAEHSDEVFEFDADAQPRADANWMNNFDSPLPPAQKEPPKEKEDLSWLHNLEEAAKQTGDLKAPKLDKDWTADFDMPSTPSEPSASEGDLSWLDRLGGIEEPSQPVSQQPAAPQNERSWLDQFNSAPTPQPEEPAEEQSASPQEDLSWLNNFDAPSEPQPFDAAPDQPITSGPFASKEDLNWLNNLGGQSESFQPFNAPVSDEGADSEKPFSAEDLSWLHNLGGTSEQPQPFDAAPNIPSAPQEDLPWLRDLGGTSEPLSTPPFAKTGELKEPPRQTAPLIPREEQPEEEPDWLKRAAEAPSMPAPGDVSMDWFNRANEPGEEKTVPPASTPELTPFSDLFSTPSEEPASLPNQDVESLFSMEMPDWLSRPEPETTEPAAPQTAVPPAEGADALAPVELPSWVQAMRPVEAVISATAPSTEDQPEEKEGPLAGLRGVLPVAPTGSSMRPKAISLKLQASDEQQTSAALLEQILGSEISPRALVTPSVIAPQRVLRWALTALFLIVLGVMVSLRSQIMPISTALPVEASSVSNTVMSIPAGAKVLAVVDYEPSLAGEMEAVSGPVLAQMATLSHPNLSFISTSPNGTALVDRLMANTKADTQYSNLGYLPGGSAGVLGFFESPNGIVPASGVQSLSDYSALILITDHAESARVWIEQLQARKQIDPALPNQPLLVIASAQAGPLLQPYVSSGQISGMLSGLSDAAKYEASNQLPSGIARSYWDTFGIGMAMSIALIVIGGLWSLFTGMRARRAEAEQG